MKTVRYFVALVLFVLTFAALFVASFLLMPYTGNMSTWFIIHLKDFFIICAVLVVPALLMIVAAYYVLPKGIMREFYFPVWFTLINFFVISTVLVAITTRLRAGFISEELSAYIYFGVLALVGNMIFIRKVQSTK